MHILISFLLLAWMTLATGCPPEESIGPKCYCRTFQLGAMMWCDNILSTDELVPLVKVTEEYDMYSLSVNNSVFQYIPSDLFRNTKFKRLRFQYTQIMALTDTDIAFEGLEDRLEQIQILEGRFVANWDWDVLKNLRRIENLDISGISLTAIEMPMPPMSSLIGLGFANTDISEIVDSAFASLQNLKIVVLKQNNLKELKRNILPEPALSLSVLDFSSNQLSTLPENMFAGMPELQHLFLSNNLFTTLDEATFAWPMENVVKLSLNGNEFRCDCRLQWLSSRKKPVEFYGTCSTPESLKGMELSKIQAKFLLC
ncbi:carboxypeptidase N subunit 2-like [Uloborus diversus]|uniref:carboxypeptidase N subunit 2-like n=1 Tax=Uloborus diversus TaxID=327109 RepID=UPI002409C570|nr:carboxypeptidase N subunit 2-like [Uloborus diversus]